MEHDPITLRKGAAAESCVNISIIEAFNVEMSQLCRIQINKDFILYVHD